MGTQAAEAKEIRDILQKLREARKGKSDSTSQRDAVDRRRRELEAMLAQAEQAYNAAHDAYLSNTSSERLQAWEAAHKRLREVQALVWPQLQALEEGAFGADRAIGRADTGAMSLERRAGSHLKTMEANVQAAQRALDLAITQAETIESWLPLYDHGRRRANALAVNVNRAKVELSADYAQDVYTLEKREAIKKIILGLASAAIGAKAAVDKALEKSLEESFKAIGTQVTKATVQELLKNPALRDQMFRTAAVQQRLLAHVLKKVAKKARKYVVKSLLKRKGAAHADAFDAADLLEEGVVYAPEDIDCFARHELKQEFDRMYFESPVKAGLKAKLFSVPAGMLTRGRGGFQQVENALSDCVKQERYFRVWEALHELAGQVSVAELARWRQEVQVLQSDLQYQSDLLQSCRRLVAEAGIAG
jgi:hypothetical protein